MKKISLLNKRFHHWIVTGESPPIKGESYWLCECLCGNKKAVSAKNLMYGKTKSCGCLSTEQKRIRETTHGMSNSPEYKAWSKMKSRCQDKFGKDWKDYGGRGIKIYGKWENFENFFKDMGRKPENHSLDRIDNNGHYEPSNCRWANKFQQANNRRNNHLINVDGVYLTIAQCAKRFKIKQATIERRINLLNWDPLKAAITPSRSKHSRVLPS